MWILFLLRSILKTILYETQASVPTLTRWERIITEVAVAEYRTFLWLRRSCAVKIGPPSLAEHGGSRLHKADKKSLKHSHLLSTGVACPECFSWIWTKHHQIDSEEFQSCRGNADDVHNTCNTYFPCEATKKLSKYGNVGKSSVKWSSGRSTCSATFLSMIRLA